jgi:signal transduction histidine kinase
VEGRISVTAEDLPRRVSIKVADNGRGIDAQDSERVFDLFRRAGVQDRPGEGIGLAHVRTLVRRVGGTIRLESTPGEGSTFIVTLPKIWAGMNPKGVA